MASEIPPGLCPCIAYSPVGNIDRNQVLLKQHESVIATSPEGRGSWLLQGIYMEMAYRNLMQSREARPGRRGVQQREEGVRPQRLCKDPVAGG